MAWSASRVTAECPRAVALHLTSMVARIQEAGMALDSLYRDGTVAVDLSVSRRTPHWVSCKRAFCNLSESLVRVSALPPKPVVTPFGNSIQSALKVYRSTWEALLP